MRGRWTVLALVGLLGLGGLASAQDGASGKTVTRDEVKSWIIEVDGKEWSARPSAQRGQAGDGHSLLDGWGRGDLRSHPLGALTQVFLSGGQQAE